MSELTPRSQETNDKLIKLAKNSQHAGKVIIIGSLPPSISIDKDEFRRFWEEQVKMPQRFIPAMDHTAAEVEWKSFRTSGQNAYNALLAYELNCMEKYDQPMGHSKPPKMGDRMVDFAIRFGTSVEQMKQHWVAVDLETRQLKHNFNLFPADGKNSKLWERQNN
tara:strand:- start:8779 stop:9270 length:492 start_codon:yes stop_codon:yes gene_type:complete